MKLKYLSLATIDIGLRCNFSCDELFQSNVNVVPQTDALARLALVTLRCLTGGVRVRAKKKVKMRSASNFNAFLFAF